MTPGLLAGLRSADLDTDGPSRRTLSSAGAPAFPSFFLRWDFNLIFWGGGGTFASRVCAGRVWLLHILLICISIYAGIYVYVTRFGKVCQGRCLSPRSASTPRWVAEEQPGSRLEAAGRSAPLPAGTRDRDGAAVPGGKELRAGAVPRMSSGGGKPS